ALLQPLWARRDGFDDVDAWIAQLDAPENIEAYRTRKNLGLAEIQTRAFDNLLAEYFVGDEVPGYYGRYFIPERFLCRGCSSPEADVYVSVWIEIEDRAIKGVHTLSPEDGKPAKYVHFHKQNSTP
ncbi:hypothetical protein D6833_08840, partial [Candidatus Parcubacteria bacterium]